DIPADFRLGQMDFAGKFQIPQKLYGRDKEIAELLLAYDRVSEGSTELLLVGGASGTGKSQLIHEIHASLTARRGWFIEGKFEQFQKNTPYKAWIQAFEEFVNLLLTETSEALAEWKQKILLSVGENGKILTDLVPKLELIIGIQAEVPDLEAIEAQTRFNLVVQNFIKIIAQAEHPLVIFLDDLQWADIASLNLLEFLLVEKNIDYLLVICAYRHQEVSISHPFMMTVEDIRKSQMPINELYISPLSQENINDLLVDTLNSTAEYTLPLAKLIYNKTQGNAFFANQFLHNLYEQELLNFKIKQTPYGQKAQWEWDTYYIEQLNFTDNVIELLMGKIEKLPATAQKIIKQAACIGNRFDVYILKLINNHQNIEDINQNLEESVFENLIIPTDFNNYKFAHDRIQQAVYSLIKEEDKKATHLSIGKALIGSLSEEEQEDELFEIVNQMNLGVELINHQEERNKLASLNYKASTKAEDAAAFEASFDYLQIAIGLLDKDCWQQDYAFTYQIYNSASQAAFNCSKFAEANHIGQKILANAKTIIEKSTVYEIQLKSLLAQNQPAPMLDLGINILKEFGVHLPRKASNLDIIKSLFSLKIAIRGKTPESFALLPPMKDEKAIVLIKLYEAIGQAAYFAEPTLLAIIIFNQVKLAAKYGNTEDTLYAYASYGLLLCGVLNDIPTGYRFGKVAEKLLAEKKVKRLEAKTAFVNNYFIYHWKEPLQDAAKGLELAYKKSLEYNGDPLFKAYCATIGDLLFYMSASKYLPDLQEQSMESAKLCLKVGQTQSYQHSLLLQQTIANLSQETEKPTVLAGDFYHAEHNKEEREKANDQAHNYTLCFNEMVLSFLFGDNPNAFKNSEIARKNIGSAMGSPFLYFYYFYDSLIILNKENIENKLLKRVNNNKKALKVSSKICPNNTLPKYHLVEAEIARVADKHEIAKQHYDKAIALAHDYKFVNDEALAWELAGKFYLSLNQSYLATFYLQNALRCYSQWGAFAKVKYLENLYPQLRQIISKTPSYANKTVAFAKTATITASMQGTITMSSILDMRSIIKASQTLSGEVVLSKLLEKMLQIVMENAGAEFAVLLQRGEAGQFKVIAESYGIGNYQALDQIGLEKYEKLATSIVNYVIRTKDSVVIDNASEDKKYSADSYIKIHQPKSILCFPITYKGRIAGIFYLENNLVEGVFTADRLEVLKLLSAQISISLENALLYENLEEKVRERTKKLQERNEEVKAQAEVLALTNKELDAKNQAITASINYAQRIQSAMLPLEEDFVKYFSEHFILFRPRDIVSGDFYWLEEKDGKIIVAAVDCTGHGVPGAFMSLISEAKLNEIVNLQEVIRADEILNALNKQIQVSLQQDATNNRDGMDMALCIIDLQAKVMEYAGAGNPLIYIQNDEAGNPQLHNIKADVYPIGGVNKNINTSFKRHLIDISKPTTFYIFSDGYQDQFGGSEKRKFMTKRFRELLFEIHQKDMPTQKKLLNDTLDTWMMEGLSPQIDDILVMGFRV
nr:AAA family ATPase [Thermoflexibacter sp.]